MTTPSAPMTGDKRPHYSYSPQRGVPGHCFQAQVWREGIAFVAVEPTDDPTHASNAAKFIADAFNNDRPASAGDGAEIVVTDEMVTAAINSLVYTGYNDATQRKVIQRQATCREYVRAALTAAAITAKESARDGVPEWRATDTPAADTTGPSP